MDSRGCWLLALLACGCNGLPGRINVGGLFEKDDEELQLAFRTAVYMVNTDKYLLKNTTTPYRSTLVAELQTLASEDSYDANYKSCDLLKRGMAALFGPQQPLTAMHVQSLCDDLEVPHIEFRWESHLRRDQLSINLYPRPEVLASAFVQLVTILHWTDFYVVYEDDNAIVQLKNFFEEREKQNWKVQLYKLQNATYNSYRETFWNISASKSNKNKTIPEHRIVLDVSRQNLYAVLRAAQQVGMMTKHQKYLITSLDLHTIDLEDFQHGKTNITGLRLVQEESLEFQKFLAEINIRRNSSGLPNLKTLKTESALAFDSVRLLAFALEHMDAAKNVTQVPPIYCNDMNKGVDGTTLFNYMKNEKMKNPGLTGMVEFDKEGFRSPIVLDILYVSDGGLHKIGQILPGNQINISTFPSDSDFEFLSLENSHFRITTIRNDPYIMFRESSNTEIGNARFEGYGIDLLNELSKLLHFTYEIHEVKDKKYGSLNSTTNEWNGLIGELLRGEANLAITDLTINTDRLKAVDFTHPFMQTGIGILFKKPTQKVTSLFSFLSPFKGEVWLLVMAAYIFVSLSLFLVGRLSPYEWSNPHPCRQNDRVEENVFSNLNSMWFTIGSMLQQGSDIAPTAMSTRAITSIWYFFCLIMTSSYTANLAAFLTIEKLVSPIENVEDLAKHPTIKYGCLSSGSTRNFFKNAEKETYQKMYRFMEQNGDVYVDSNPDGIQKVEEGNYAYLMEGASIEYITERHCNLTHVGHLLDSKGYGIAVPKDNHKLRAWLSGGILTLQERGLLHTFKERWWKQKKGGGKCEAAKSSGSVNELGLGNVGGVFVVMLLGICLSACVGVVEFLWYQRRVQRDSEMSLLKLLVKEIKYAVTCGSSSRPAPKMKNSGKEVEETPPKALVGYNSLY